MPFSFVLLSLISLRGTSGSSPGRSGVGEFGPSVHALSL
jgi:hypothetical protein